MVEETWICWVNTRQSIPSHWLFFGPRNGWPLLVRSHTLPLGCWEMDLCLAGQSSVTLEDRLGAAPQKTQISFLIFLMLVFCLFMSVMVSLCF